MWGSGRLSLVLEAQQRLRPSGDGAASVLQRANGSGGRAGLFARTSERASGGGGGRRWRRRQRPPNTAPAAHWLAACCLVCQRTEGAGAAAGAHRQSQGCVAQLACLKALMTGKPPGCCCCGSAIEANVRNKREPRVRKQPKCRPSFARSKLSPQLFLASPRAPALPAEHPQPITSSSRARCGGVQVWRDPRLLVRLLLPLLPQHSRCLPCLSDTVPPTPAAHSTRRPAANRRRCLPAACRSAGRRSNGPPLMAAVVLYASSCAGTRKAKGDISRIKCLLDAKRVQYEEASRALVCAARRAPPSLLRSARVPFQQPAPACADLLPSPPPPPRQVDLSMEPHRREGMLAGSDGLTSIPQLHVNGRNLGSAEELQAR